MIWQNPWAWLGLLSLAVPVFIHLLGRRNARVLQFPTLRFLEAARLLPSRRTRLSDPWLLAVRIAILAFAVTALAQPLLLTARRRQGSGSAAALAIVVDTSVSMRRPAPAGGRALDAARSRARQLAGDAGTAVILESASPARTLKGALAWLQTQPGARSLIVVSDFQLGTLERADLADVPADVGVRLERIAVRPDSAPIAAHARVDSVETTARIVLAAGRTDVEWSAHAAATPLKQPVIQAGTAERARADAAGRAARTLAVSAETADQPVAIVYPGYERRAELLRNALPLDQPWMAEVVTRLRASSLLAAAAASLTTERGTGDDSLSSAGAAAGADSAFTVVARTAAALPVVWAARGEVQGHEGLLLFASADAGSVLPAALIAAVPRALSTAPPVRELEPGTLSDTALLPLQREASAAARGARGGEGESDGRWLWLLALALLGFETWLRRAPQHNVTAVGDERVA